MRILSTLIVLAGVMQQLIAQPCSQKLQSGHQVLSNSEGCAPFTYHVQNLFKHSTPDTKFTVNWGDGTVETYIGSDDPVDYTPDFIHIYQDLESSNCGYQITIEATNDCTQLGEAGLSLNTSIWNTDQQGLNISPKIIRVCRGFAADVSFTDLSDWNCFPRGTFQNNPPRWVQWNYLGGAISNTLSNTKSIVIPVFATGQKSDLIRIDDHDGTGKPYEVGDKYIVELRNWNWCNPYDDPYTSDVTPDPFNKDEGEHDPVTTTAQIVIVEAPLADFQTRLSDQNGFLISDFTPEQSIYFDNLTANHENMVYAWEFFDDDQGINLLNTSNERYPVFNYQNPGRKMIRLKVKDNSVVGDCEVEEVKFVNVSSTELGFESCPVFVADQQIGLPGLVQLTPEMKPMNNSVLEFSSLNNELDGIIIPRGELNQYESNFSYDFWAYTEKSITLLAEKTTGVTVKAIYGQNFAVWPNNNGFYGGRGTGVSIGTNGVSVVEHEGNFFDARLTYATSLSGWNHYCVVYENDNIKLYINGSLVKEKAKTNVKVRPHFILGMGYPKYDLNDGYKGKLDEFRVWGKSLSQNEIVAVKNKKILNPDFQDLALYYSFDCCQSATDNAVNAGLNDGELRDITSGQFKIEDISIDGYIDGISLLDYTVESNLQKNRFIWPDDSRGDSFSLNVNQDTAIYFFSSNNGAICRDSVFIDLVDPNDGLVAWYPFNGNANDESGNANHGVVNGAVLSMDRFNNINSAYKFDGIDDLISVASLNELFDSNEITLSAWFKLDEIYSDLVPQHYIIDKRKSDDEEEFYLNVDGSLIQALGNEFSDPNLEKDQWYQITCSFNGNSLNYYINGQLVSSFENQLFDVSDNFSEMLIGSRYSKNEFLKGSIDDIKIFKRVLNESEISNLFDLPRIDIVPSNTVQSGSEINLQGVNFTAIDSIKIDDILVTNYTISSAQEISLTIPSGTSTGKITTYTGGIADESNQILNIGNPLNGGLVAWYPFTGNANDESGNGNHGVVNRAVLDYDRFGNPESSYFFDGNSSSDPTKIEAEFGNVNTLSISLWVKVKEYDNYYPSIIFFSRPVHGVNLQLLGLYGDNPIYLNNEWTGAIGGYPEFSDETVKNDLHYKLRKDKWYNIVVVIDSLIKQRAIYVNGLKLKSGEANDFLNLDLTSKISIGSNFDGYTSEGYGHMSFHGNIDDVKIYNYPLSQSKINALFDLPRIDQIPTTTVQSGSEINLQGVNFTAIDSIKIDEILVTNYTISSAQEISLTIPSGTSSGKITTYTGGIAYESSQILNIDNPLNDGLVGWYPFNGNTNDESGYNNNGTAIGAKLASDRFGNINSAYKCSNFSDHVNIPHAQQNNFNAVSNSYSIVFYAMEANDWDHKGCIIAKDGFPGYPYKLQSGYSAENEYGLSFATWDWSINKGGNARIDSFFWSKNWKQIVHIVNQETDSVYSYVDGILMNQSLNLVENNGANDWSITFGNSWGHDRPFNGSIDDLRLYNRALSSDEVAALFDLPRIDTAPTVAVQPASSVQLQGVNFTSIDSIKIDDINVTSFTINSDSELNLTIPSGATNGIITTYTGGIAYKAAQALNIDTNPSGPVAMYSFSGDAADVTGNGHDGVIYGAQLTTDRFGSPNAAYYFNGSNNYIETSKAWPDMAEGTISAWVYHESGGGAGTILTDGSINVGGADFLIQTTDQSILFRADKNGGLNYEYGAPAELQNLNLANRWHQIAWTFTGNQHSIYLDGNLLISINESGNNVGFKDPNSYIGARRVWDNLDSFFKGKIDELKIYDRALSAEEIAAEFDLPVITTVPDSEISAGQEIQLTGSNFTAIDSIKIDQILVDDYTLNSDQQISMTLPSGATTGKITTFTGGVAYEAADALNINNTPGILTLNFPHLEAAPGDLVQVMLTVENFNDLISAQFTVGWDPAILLYNSINQFAYNGLNSNDEQTDNGLLSISWNDENLIPQSLADHEPLMTLTFEVIGQKDQVSNIVLNGDLTKIEFGDQDFKPVDYQLNSGSIKVIDQLQLTGYITTPGNLPLAKVNLQYTIDQEQVMLESQADGAYQVTFSRSQKCKVVPVSHTSNEEFHGVTTLDIALARRDILGIKKLNNVFSEIAADANGDGAITTIDLALIRRVVLAISTTFDGDKIFRFIRPKPNATLQFNAYDTAWSSLTEPFSENLDFTAVKIGDVNASWRQNSGRMKTHGEINLEMIPIDSGKDSVFTVEVTAYGTVPVAGYQFGMQWDNSQYDLIKAEPAVTSPAFNFNRLQEGILNVSWDHPEGNALDLDEQSVFTLTFRRKTSGIQTGFTLFQQETPPEAYDSNLDLLKLNFRGGNITFNEPEKLLNLYPVSPNPFTDRLNFMFELKRSGVVRLNIYDAQGRLIDQLESEMQAGVQQLEWDATLRLQEELNKGIYLYRLSFEDMVEEGKVIRK